LFLLFLALNLHFVNSFQEEDSVIVLKDDNFDNLVDSDQSDWLLEFYAPWCGHCKKLAPTYSQLATFLKEPRPNVRDVRVAKIDCTQQTELGRRFGIRGFPTLKLLSQGKMFDYRGNRTFESFIEFINGGFKEIEPHPIPTTSIPELPRSGGSNDFQFTLFGRVIHLNVWVISGVIAGVSASIAVMVMFFFIMMPSNTEEQRESPSQENEQSKSQQPAKDLKQD